MKGLPRSFQCIKYLFKSIQMELLEHIHEFKSSPALREALYEHAVCKEFPAGTVILQENAYIRAIPIVTKGALKVLRADEEGRELLIYYVRAGESCIMSFLGGLHHETSKVRAEADEDVEILLLPMDKVVHFMKDFPEWLDYIFKLYHKRFEELLDVVNAIAFKKVDERLLDLLRRKEKMSASKVLHITHEQLANELGTARVLVSRLLKQLEEQGILELGRNKITLK